jgi:hypothetical protein
MIRPLSERTNRCRENQNCIAIFSMEIETVYSEQKSPKPYRTTITPYNHNIQLPCNTIITHRSSCNPSQNFIEKKSEISKGKLFGVRFWSLEKKYIYFLFLYIVWYVMVCRCNDLYFFRNIVREPKGPGPKNVFEYLTTANLFWFLALHRWYNPNHIKRKTVIWFTKWCDH